VWKISFSFFTYHDIVPEKACSELENNHSDERNTSGSQPDDETDDYESNEDEPLFSKRATLFYIKDDNSCKVCKLH